MNDYELYELGAKPILRKKKIFFFIALGVLGGGGFFGLISLLMLAIPEGGVAALTLFILIVIPCVVAAVVLYLQSRKIGEQLNDREAVIEQGRRIEKKKFEKDERKKEKEAEKAEQIRKIEEKAQADERLVAEGLTPDFKSDKEFSGLTAKVWLNFEEKLIQFSFPSGENITIKHAGDGKLSSWLNRDSQTKALYTKTKILKLSDLKEVELTSSYEDVSTKGIKADAYQFIGAHGSVDVKKSETRVYYHQLEFRFNDIDYPVVYVYFSDKKQEAERLKETIKMLIEA